jgi:hypothetical protein
MSNSVASSTELSHDTHSASSFDIEAVQILGRGCSLVNYREAPAGTEVWTINMMQFAIKWDRAFWLDNIQYIAETHSPFLVQMIGQNAYKSGKQVYTINPLPGIDFLQKFPHEKIVEALGDNWFNNSFAWMIGYAIYRNVKTLWLDGTDFMAPNEVRSQQAACAAYWLGYAKARGMEVSVNPASALLDTAPRQNPRWMPYGINPKTYRDGMLGAG